MSRELTFECPFDIPRTPRQKTFFRHYLDQIFEQNGGQFGDMGQKVGFGFVWETKTGLSEFGLNTLSNRMQRALKTSLILSRRAEVYFLLQRINYTRTGEPNAIFTLREE